MHFSYFQQQFWMHFYKLPKQQIHKLQTQTRMHTHRHTGACICMHRNDMEKAHINYFYILSLFLYCQHLCGNCAMKRRSNGERNCSELAAERVACMDLHLCSQTVAAHAPHLTMPAPCHVQLLAWAQPWARTLSIRQRWRWQRKQSATTRRIRDIYERYAANGSAVRMRHISALKQATKEAKTKTKQNKNQKRSVQKIELTKLCILAL